LILLKTKPVTTTQHTLIFHRQSMSLLDKKRIYLFSYRQPRPPSNTHYYQPLSRGDNTFCSVRVCVHPFVYGRSPV